MNSCPKLTVYIHPETTVAIEWAKNNNIRYEIIDESKPYAVESLKAAAYGKNKARLSWDKVENADGYLIYGKHGSDGKYGYIGMTTKNNYYIDKNALDTDYNFYWVFSHIVNNDDGTYQFLGQKSAQEYIYGILDAAKEDGDLSLSHILDLDKKGIEDAALFNANGEQVGQAYIHGIISGFNENATDISMLTHFAGKEGALGIIKDKNIFKDLTDVDLKSIDITKGNLDEVGTSLKDVVDKAIEIGVVSDDSAESVAKVVDILTDMGLTGSVSIDNLTKSFTEAQDSINKTTSNMESLKSILSESVSGAGMSADSVKAFKDMFGDDADKALEKTANGYHLNQKALAQLQEQQKQSTKTDYLGSLADQQEALRKVEESISKGLLAGQDVSAYATQRDSIKQNIETLQDLAYQYENALSAYNQWQAAMSGGEEGDMYDSIQGNLESAKELYDKGLTGTNKFREFVDLMSNQDLSTASNEEIVSAYESAMPKIKRYFTEGQEGAVNFLKDIQDINSEWAHMNDDGSWKIDFGVGNDQEIADKLGIDVEAVQAVMRKLKDYGFDINLDQPVQSLDELKASAESAKESLVDMNETSFNGINLDSSSFSEVTDEIEKVQSYIETIQEDSEIDPDVKTEKLQHANEILEYLVQQQQELGQSDIEINLNVDQIDSRINDLKEKLNEFKFDDGTVDLSVEGAQEAADNLQTLLYQKEQLTNTSAVLTVDASQVDGNIGTAIAKIQEYQTAVNNLNAQTELQKAGVQIDTSDAQAKVQQLAGEIQGLDGETKASLGLDTSEFDSALSTVTNTKIDVKAGVNLDTSALGTIQSTISGITPEVLVKAGVDSSLVTGYNPEEKESKVKFTAEHSAVDAYTPQNKSAKVTYTVSVTGLENIPGNKTRTVTYNVKSSGSVAPANGTAHSIGTAHAAGTAKNLSVNRNWGLKQNEPHALVNELKPEIIVRDGEPFVVNGGDPAFTSLRQGDIVFNGEQSEALLKNGYVTGSHGKLAYEGAHSLGTAFSNGTGKFNVGSSGSKSSSSSKKKSSKSSSKSSSNSSNSSSKSNSSSNSSNDKEETKETLDWIETKLDRIKRKIDELDTTASSTYRTWSKRNEALSSEFSKVTEKISLQQQAYDRYIKEAESAGEGLSSDWIDKIQNGKIDIETITDSDLKEKISDYKNWYEKALDCRDAIVDLKEQESKLIEQRFNNIKDEYDAILKQFEHTQSMLEGAIDITETSGYIVSTKYYDSLISNENEKINKLYAEREALVNSLNSALSSGKIDKYSESWYNMQDEIDSIDESIQDCNKSTIEWGNSIRQIQWDLFDKLQDRISKINDEADFLKELMSSEKMYDDKNGGQITEYGKATFGLHGVKHNTLMAQADEYRKEMEKIDEQLKSDPFNQTLLDRRSELRKLQQESITSAKQEKDAIKDLVEDGINSQLDALQKLIDKYTDLLDTNKDMYDYQKQLAEKQKEISSIEKQLAAYQGDTSEEGASKRQQLQNDLNDAKQDLAETQYERSIADQKKLLDDLYEQYEEVLNMRLDNIDVLVSDVITNVNSEAGAIRDTLEAKADSVGYTMTGSMNTIWNSANQVITNYGTNFLSSITGVQNAINDLTNLIKQAVDASNKKASASSSSSNKPSSSTSTPQPVTPTPKPATTSSGDGVPNVGDAVTFNSGAYYYSSDGISPTGTQMHGQTVYITKINNASWAKKKYHIAKDRNAAHPLGWVDLSQISGYEKGIKSVPKDEMAVVGEHKKPETIVLDDGSILTPLSKNSSVFNNDAHENLWSFANDPQRFIDSMIQNPPEVPNMFNEFTANQTFNFDVKVDNPANYAEFYSEMMRRFQKDVKAEKIIQDMTLGQITGKGSMSKYRQRF